MSQDGVLVDSDILIDIGREDATAKTYLQTLQQNNDQLAISTISVMELLVGARNKQELVTIQKFVENFAHIHLTPTIDRQAIVLLKEYRLSHGLLIPDALIAATAVAMGYPLASKNQKDYRFIAELSLLPYPVA